MVQRSEGLVVTRLYTRTSLYRHDIGICCMAVHSRGSTKAGLRTAPTTHPSTSSPTLSPHSTYHYTCHSHPQQHYHRLTFSHTLLPPFSHLYCLPPTIPRTPLTPTCYYTTIPRYTRHHHTFCHYRAFLAHFTPAPYTTHYPSLPHTRLHTLPHHLPYLPLHCSGDNRRDFGMDGANNVFLQFSPPRLTEAARLRRVGVHA